MAPRVLMQPGPRLIALLFLLLFALPGCHNAEERKQSVIQNGKALYERGELAKAALEFRSALQIDPLAAEPTYYLALIAERQGDIKSAFGLLQGLTQRTPDHVEAQLKLGQLALQLNDEDRALSAAEAVLARASANADAHALKSAVLLRRGKLTEAEAEIGLAQEAEPQNPHVLVVLAGIRARQNRLADSIAILNEGITRFPQDDGLKLVRLTLAEQQGDKAGAEQVLRQLVATNPANESYPRALAGFLNADGRAEAAEAVLRQAIGARPKSVSLKITLAEFLAGRKGWEAGERELLAYESAEPNEPAFRFALAALYRQAGHADRSESVLRDIIVKNGTTPQGLTARSTLASQLLGEGRGNDATALIEEILKTDPGRADALILRAQIALVAGDFQKGIGDLTLALRSAPQFKPAQVLLAKAYMASGANEQGLATLEQALNGDPSDDSLRLDYARALLGTGKTEDAATQILAVLDRAPQSPVALIAGVDLSVAQQNFAEAERYLKALSALPGADSGELATQIHLYRGKALEAQKRYAEAIPELEAVLRAAPQARAAQAMLVDCYINAGQTDTARRFLADLAQRQPASADPALLLYALENKDGHKAEAEAALHEAIRRQPDRVDSYVMLGNFFEQNGRTEQAVEAFQGGLSRAPSNTALLRHLGGALDKLNRFEPARQAYEAVLKQNPKDTAIANNLAIMIADAWPNDATLLSEAARLSQEFRLTTDPVLLDTQGWVQYRLGNFQDAVALIQSAAERMPDEGQIHYHLGMAYQAQGDQERAQAELRLAVSGSEPYRGREEAQKALGVN